MEAVEKHIQIRPLRREDIPCVEKLERAYYSLPWSGQSFLDAMGREGYLFLAADTDGNLAGYCGCLRSFEIAEITNVTVREEYRRRGIARQMLLALMKTARDLGTERFTLEVRRSNEGAIALYQSLGFRQEGVRRGYYESPREDALILWTGRCKQTDTVRECRRHEVTVFASERIISDFNGCL